MIAIGWSAFWASWIPAIAIAPTEWFEAVRIQHLLGWLPQSWFDDLMARFEGIETGKFLFFVIVMCLKGPSSGGIEGKGAAAITVWIATSLAVWGGFDQLADPENTTKAWATLLWLACLYSVIPALFKFVAMPLLVELACCLQEPGLNQRLSRSRRCFSLVACPVLSVNRQCNELLVKPGNDMSLNFALSESEALYRDQIRRFARSELAPMRQKWDQEYQRPQEMVLKALEAGLLDTDMSHVMRGIMIEEVGYADFNCALPFLVTTEPFELNRLDGVPDDVRNPVREAVRTGQTIIAVGFTEPSSGTDVANFQSTAVLDGDEWVLNAVKNSISWADAEYFTITCRTEEREKGIWSLSNFFVPRDTPGVQAPRLWHDMGTHGAARGEVRFEDVRIPKNYLVGDRGKAYLQMAQLFDTNRAYIGLKCIGAAQASIDETCEFAKQRKVMGKSISSYQGISFPLVEAETQLEAARLLCYKTLWLRDQEMPNSKEGGMCKWWVPELTYDIVRQCLTIHGHYGYSDELPFEQRLRDILGWQIGDGTSQVSKLIVARSMFGKGFSG